LIAICAMLIQALVFAWHHHDLRLLGHAAPGLASLSGGHAGGLAADDDCPICQTIHHQTAAPPAFAALPMPAAGGPADLRFDRAAAARRAYLLFSSRAPPLV
jgi:hypothetical protein